MVQLADYITSFLRLNPHLRGDIRFLPAEKTDRYHLLIHDHFVDYGILPDRICRSISHISLKIKGDTSHFSILNFPNCSNLTIRGNNEENEFSFEGHKELIDFDISKLNVDRVKLRKVENVKNLNIRTHHLIQNYSQFGRTIQELHLMIDRHVKGLDLTNFDNLHSLSFNGFSYQEDLFAMNQVTLPRGIDKLELHSIRAKELDLSNLTFLKELYLYNLTSGKDMIQSERVKVHWPGNGTASNLEKLFIEGTTFADAKLIFDNFPNLQQFYFEDHMNSKIILKDLVELKSFKTSVARFVIGHTLDIYLINLPKLEKIRTGHRITKYLWNCPLITEFSQNEIQLTKPPKNF